MTSIREPVTTTSTIQSGTADSPANRSAENAESVSPNSWSTTNTTTTSTTPVTNRSTSTGERTPSDASASTTVTVASWGTTLPSAMPRSCTRSG